MFRFFSLSLTFMAWCLSTTLSAQTNHELFRIVNDEYSAWIIRSGLLKTAQKEILFSTFIIKNDEIGNAKLKLLSDAARRGVKVRVILDDLGNKMPRDLLLYAASQGVEIKIFNKKNWLKLSTVIRRMHGKMLITDSTFLLVGGRNVDNEYFHLDSVSNFLDREVLIRGERAVGNAHQHFMALWQHEELCVPLVGTLTEDKRQRAKETFEKAALRVAADLPMLRALRARDTVRT